MNSEAENVVINTLSFAATGAFILLTCRRRKVSTSAFGTALIAYDQMLKNWGMLGNYGLIVGRTLSGKLIRFPRFCHTILVGSPGSGKGVGFIVPNLLTYRRGSVIVHDTKGDLFAITSKQRRRMGRVIQLAPFGKGDKWNPLDTIREGPLLIDHAKSMASSLVVLGEKDKHWDEKATQIIAAILVYVLLRLHATERNLNSVLDLASDPSKLYIVGVKLKTLLGIPSVMGAQIHGLFESATRLTEEGFSVISTVTRHLDFLTSESVAASVSASTFNAKQLLISGTTLYLNIPQSQLEAQRGLLRLWVSTLIREIGAYGSERSCEVLMMLDEASALDGLSGINEALVRGRSSGVRMVLVYQSDAQIKTAFRDKPSLIYDCCSTQIYLGASSIETADRLSKICGNWTQPVESIGTSENYSGGHGPSGDRRSHGRSSTLAPQGRPLFYPDEILRMRDDLLFAFQSGFPATILAQRLRYYEDPDFNPEVPRPRYRIRLWDVLAKKWAIGLIVVVLSLWLIVSKKNQRATVQYGWNPQTKQISPVRNDPKKSTKKH